MIVWCVLGIALATEGLYEAPCQFWDNLPIASLRVSIPGHGVRSLKLLIDSGADQSFFFPGQTATSARLMAGGVSLGTEEFVDAPRDKMSPQAATLMRKLGVDGSLGVDFLRSHDVLVDYGQSRVYFSKETDAIDPPGGLTLFGQEPQVRRTKIDLSVRAAELFGLVDQDGIFFVPATLGSGETTACLMALDTGTGESALPLEIAAKLSPTGVKREIVGFQGKSMRSKEYRAEISIADNSPREIRVLGSDARGPILGGNAFRGHRLLLMLRLARANYW